LSTQEEKEGEKPSPLLYFIEQGRIAVKGIDGEFW
jgi:hypothetical protein